MEIEDSSVTSEATVKSSNMPSLVDGLKSSTDSVSNSVKKKKRKSQTVENITLKELDAFINKFLAGEKLKLYKINYLCSKISTKLAFQY